MAARTAGINRNEEIMSLTPYVYVLCVRACVCDRRQCCTVTISSTIQQQVLAAYR